MKIAGVRLTPPCFLLVIISSLEWLVANAQKDYSKQRDLIDLAMMVIGKDPDARGSNMNATSRKLHLSGSPILEYTTATGFTTGVAVAGAFLTGAASSTNVSSWVSAVKYTERKQFLAPVETSFWTTGNSWNFAGDWRYLHFPQDSYGIGGHTNPDDRYTITYKYFRFYEYALRNIGHHWYAGSGFQLDRHWNIAESNVPSGAVTDFQRYQPGSASTSSGLAVDLLFDNRQNSINPAGGAWYGNLVFLQNAKMIGSDGNWNSLMIDIRKYFAAGKRNVLGFWFYSVLGLGGRAPYLDLPGTGTDTYNNTARGYEEDRYIGKRYIDLEAEYRFGITRNGLLGAVLFCNAGSVSDFGTNRFEVILPGAGIGLRIKFNKFSDTNACADYGWGIKGSSGFFGNLGEVF
ncbi:MAG TPA: hypothetical protein VGR89_14860 [Puia sp.]|nr:hypothetical protein [Puia sp.]